ncbi:tRNA (5-methylaminomethyl-2-thiouridine)(34)-methyltransferase MnmD [Sulfurimonas sp.]|uniref:tRNA (5-methylaminomethyl-2-thiouridine)(34)-methyltransferase MnmD n=1 Tax=Sulfurimonas sp. TaxID=2022749 RepID=UPI002B4991CB|nr:MnmC family methyltransferase [Sulfurimonas sp.]
MPSFNNELHAITLSKDGTYTAYSKEYDEHYHSTEDGALNESLLKHVLPAFSEVKDKDEINILDICYGLGFNTLATLYYHKKNSLTSKLNIYSPELDAMLLSSLKNFTYPKEFEDLKEIIYKLCEDGVYEDEFFYIEIFVGDAREYVRKFTNKFDIVYQDAFSPSANPTLWTLEYFADIKKAMKEDGVLTTYSIALAIRLALWQNGFNVYTNSSENIRVSTLASIQKLQNFKEVDMPHKISCNPDAKPLRD